MANVKKAFTGEVQLSFFLSLHLTGSSGFYFFVLLKVRDLVDPYVEVCFAGHKVNYYCHFLTLGLSSCCDCHCCRQ